jgi:pSer/pThr/pTyr-binding forkhead associated (FHA) protein
MFCPKCGFKNSDGADFCARCGTKIIAETDAQTTVSYQPTDDERESLGSAPARPENATLVIRSGGGRAGETYELTAERTSIGRHPNADIFLDDVTVSRNHAVIDRSDAGFVISDEGSLNGTYLNRRRIERQVLADGDELQIGKYKLTFIAP